MKRRFGIAVAILAGMIAAGAWLATPASADPYQVTTEADAGAGSLRDALTSAAADGSPSTITFAPNVNTIALDSGLMYGSDLALTIEGGGVSVTQNAALAAPLLLIEDSDRIVIRDITFRDGGNDGLRIDPDLGPIDITLDGVIAKGNGLNGVDIFHDQDVDLPVTVRDSVFAGNGENGLLIIHQGNADIRLEVHHSTFSGNDINEIVDDGGLRVDQDGKGDIYATITGSHFVDNVGDGAFFHNEDEGDINLDISYSIFDRNGSIDENDSDDGLRVLTEEGTSGEQDITISHSVFNNNGEDGFDSDASNDATIDVEWSEANGNADDGWDLDPEDDEAFDGAVYTVNFSHVAAHHNGKPTDDNLHHGIILEATGEAEKLIVNIEHTSVSDTGPGTFKIEDDDTHHGLFIHTDGDIDIDAKISTTHVVRSTADTADGLRILSEEGDISAVILGSELNENSDDGLKIKTIDDGDIEATIAFTAARRNGENGLDINSDFDADVSIWKATVTDAPESGIALDAEHEGRLAVIGSLITGSAGPGVEVDAESGLLQLFFNTINYNGAPWTSNVRVVSFLNWLT